MSTSAQPRPGFIDTVMNFSGQVTGRARVDAPNWANTNMALEPHALRLFDARPAAAAGRLSLDREGFTLVRHACGLAEASDIDAEAAPYLAATGAMLQGLVGASLVLPQGKGLLRRVNQAGAIGPSRWTHLDYTEAAAHRWVEWIEAWEDRPLRQYRRFAVLQTWRCLTPAPADNTLALCDASTLDAGDRIVFDACVREPYDEPGNVFESQFTKFNDGQRWYYFADLAPDELIIFKGFDSDPACNAMAPHNSIDLPGAGARPRVSVEARFFAFFD